MPISPIKFVPPLIAHRGASSIAPENTLAAFLLAKQQGATWVEFDVMLTADGEAVVIHDESLERTTNGIGDVDKIIYSQLAKLDAGSWFNPAFADERVPTLREVITFLKKHQLAANVEIKAIPGQEAAVVTKVLAEIKQYWSATMTPPLISSFSMPILQQVRQQQPEALIGMLIHEWFDGWEEIAEALNPVSMNMNEEIMTPTVATQFKNNNKLITCYTVNQPARAMELFAMGVDAVFTDRVPELLTAIQVSE
ncbi:MAG: glycerophosphoryl diester phosphodiesterase [Pseudomonadota bacterium]